MEAVEESPPCHVIANDLSPVAKGKRTKRHRPLSPATAEEEEVAGILILLSQGPSPNWHDHEPKPASRAAAGCMYACKTCGRAFSSFQALGGHRTSHKKPKNEKRPSLFSGIIDEDYPSPSSSKKRIPPPSLSLQLSSASASPSPRVHECSYCGAEFTSGQALGGHMRRHRAGPISPLPSPGGGSERAEPVPKKPRSGLCLDLNFPAPEDENRRSGFDSGPEKLALSIATTALVDCQF